MNNKINPDEMSVDEKVSYLSRGTVEVITPEDLRWKLENANKNNPLIVKYGIDPTAPEIHIGHAVPIRKLRHFQDLGYDIQFLIGDFTARIGDPSGRSKERVPMTEEQVKKNSDVIQEQVFKILLPEKTNIVYNSSWLKPLQLEDFIKLLGKNTVNNLIKRKGFSKRLNNGMPVAGHELIYPFLQAYDSVFLKADIEVGGTDQYFNLIFARDLQPKYGQEQQVIVTTPLLEGLDGNEKMSKSLGNTVGIQESAKDMYRKIMKIKDNLISKYFELLTNIDFNDLAQLEIAYDKGTLHPRDFKMKLAKMITNDFHSPLEAKLAEEEFVRVYTKGELPKDIPEVSISYKDITDGSLNPVELMRYSNLAKSNSEAKRITTQNGFRVEDEVINDPYKKIPLQDNMIIRVGKKRFVKIKYDKEQV